MGAHDHLRRPALERVASIYGSIVTAGVFYLCLTFILVKLFKLAERRWLSYLAPRKH